MNIIHLAYQLKCYSAYKYQLCGCDTNKPFNIEKNLIMFTGAIKLFDTQKIYTCCYLDGDQKKVYYLL